MDIESAWDSPDKFVNNNNKRNVTDELSSKSKRPRRELNFDVDDDGFPDEDDEFDFMNEATVTSKPKVVQPVLVEEPPPPRARAEVIPPVIEADEPPAVVVERERPIQIKYRQVLKHIPDVPYVPISCSDGSRVYLRVLPEKPFELPPTNNNNAKKSTKSLLAVGFHELRKQAEVSKNKFHEALARVVDTESLGAVGKQEDLWVEKYKPKSYWDLLSDETTNRALLHWLKLWDKTVFGNDYLAKYKQTREKYSKLEAKEKEKEFGFGNRKAEILDDDYDEIGRPKQKIALLHGPPGLGKTTCAHIIARHAGYNVIELNASDDRSKEIFQRTLDSTTQMRPETFKDGRPTCLIIDEIDGAPTETINVLIDWIVGKATEKGKKKLKKVLRRPVICICNDLYTMSLKNLRQYAFILHFQPVNVSNLLQRMAQIAIKENLCLNDTLLHKLCEKTECDIRSCLSSMQFLKQKRESDPYDVDIFDQIGKKDVNKGIFSLWKDIFTLPEGKKKYTSSLEDTTKPSFRFNYILTSVQSFGDYEKLQSGIFENYLHAKFKDSYFQSIIQGLEWTQWFEKIHNHISRTQNYSAFGYLPLYFVNAHFLFATKNMVKIHYPSAEKLSRIPKFKSIIKSQLSDISPVVGRYLDERNMILDVIPSLIPILQPGTIRPIPTQLWNAEERATVNHIVEIMIMYNLSYSQQREEDGSYNYVLEPNVESIGRFPLQEGTTRPKFPYTVKQLVAREISMEKLRRNESAIEPTESNKARDLHSEPMVFDDDTPPTLQDSVPPTTTESSSKTEEALSKKEKPQVGGEPSISTKGLDVKLAKSPKVPIQLRDFFGRPIARSAESIQAEEKKMGDIWFRFKEGYSNAVKKNIKLKDLL